MASMRSLSPTTLVLDEDGPIPGPRRPSRSGERLFQSFEAADPALIRDVLCASPAWREETLDEILSAIPRAPDGYRISNGRFLSVATERAGMRPERFWERIWKLGKFGGAVGISGDRAWYRPLPPYLYRCYPRSGTSGSRPPWQSGSTGQKVSRVDWYAASGLIQPWTTVARSALASVRTGLPGWYGVLQVRNAAVLAAVLQGTSVARAFFRFCAYVLHEEFEVAPRGLALAEPAVSLVAPLHGTSVGNWQFFATGLSGERLAVCLQRAARRISRKAGRERICLPCNLPGRSCTVGHPTLLQDIRGVGQRHGTGELRVEYVAIRPDDDTVRLQNRLEDERIQMRRRRWRRFRDT